MARPKLISFLTRRLPEGASSAALERQGFFSTGQPVAAVNTLIFEQGPVISPNGSEFFYSSFDQGSGRGAEIYMADRDDEGILEAPRAVTEVNTIAQDVVLALSRDGLTLYFASDRPGSQDWDIWWATRPSLQEAFGEPEIVTELSTPSMDGFVGLSITGDDRELYFARHRVGDIFVAWRSSNDEPWGNVTQVTELDNRPGAGEGGPMISSDGLTIFFMAWDRSGGFGDHDLWMATRPDRFDEQGSRVPFGEPINLGPAINSAKIEWQPALSPDWPAAGSQIYYSTGLRDQDYDIYVARWHPDCNGNMIDDLEEISRGDARDGNANGIPDECETRSIEIKRED